MLQMSRNLSMVALALMLSFSCKQDQATEDGSKTASADQTKELETEKAKSAQLLQDKQAKEEELKKAQQDLVDLKKELEDIRSNCPDAAKCVSEKEDLQGQIEAKNAQIDQLRKENTKLGAPAKPAGPPVLEMGTEKLPDKYAGRLTELNIQSVISFGLHKEEKNIYTEEISLGAVFYDVKNDSKRSKRDVSDFSDKDSSIFSLNGRCEDELNFGVTFDPRTYEERSDLSAFLNTAFSKTKDATLSNLSVKIDSNSAIKDELSLLDGKMVSMLFLTMEKSDIFPFKSQLTLKHVHQDANGKTIILPKIKACHLVACDYGDCSSTDSMEELKKDTDKKRNVVAKHATSISVTDDGSTVNMKFNTVEVDAVNNFVNDFKFTEDKIIVMVGLICEGETYLGETTKNAVQINVDGRSMFAYREI